VELTRGWLGVRGHVRRQIYSDAPQVTTRCAAVREMFLLRFDGFQHPITREISRGAAKNFAKLLD